LCIARDAPADHGALLAECHGREQSQHGAHDSEAAVEVSRHDVCLPRMSDWWRVDSYRSAVAIACPVMARTAVVSVRAVKLLCATHEPKGKKPSVHTRRDQTASWEGHQAVRCDSLTKYRRPAVVNGRPAVHIISLKLLITSRLAWIINPSQPRRTRDEPP
jgi:hypothetical protein